MFFAQAVNHLIEERGQQFLLLELTAFFNFDNDLIAADFRGYAGRENYGTAELLIAQGALVIILTKAHIEDALG